MWLFSVVGLKKSPSEQRVPISGLLDFVLFWRTVDSPSGQKMMTLLRILLPWKSKAGHVAAQRKQGSRVQFCSVEFSAENVLRENNREFLLCKNFGQSQFYATGTFSSSGQRELWWDSLTLSSLCDALFTSGGFQPNQGRKKHLLCCWQGALSIQ